MFIAVDLPEPLGPMMATNSPASMSRSMPRNAWKLAVPAAVGLGHAAQADQRLADRHRCAGRVVVRAGGARRREARAFERVVPLTSCLRCVDR